MYRPMSWKYKTEYISLSASIMKRADATKANWELLDFLAEDRK